jgi:2,4-dienoyl-CoA reductase-like NADH-dependent reductase (Old Yellow Enzyme family)
MCQYSAEDGLANAWHMQWLGSLATGGHGLVFTEATAVSPVGRHSLNDAGMWRDDHVTAWAPIVEFCRSYGATMGIQLAHAGRKAATRPPWLGRSPLSREEGGWQTVAPSEVPHDGLPAPHALTTSEIADVVDYFVQAARRAIRAGFQVIEIHAAHGYLLHEFLSPLSNLRTDEYGGSLENRTRIVREVMSAVRSEVGEGVPVFVRLSCTDYVDGGWTIDDTVALSAMLKNAGCDLIDCSSGGVAPIKLTEADVGPGYQVKFAQAVREGAKIATGAVGLITDAEQAEVILQEGKADAILVARAAMRNPHFAMAAAEQLGEVIEWPPQLDRARRVKQR